MADRKGWDAAGVRAARDDHSSRWPRYGWLVVAALGLIPFLLGLLGLAFANLCENDDCSTAPAWICLAVGGIVIIGGLVAFVGRLTRDQ